MPCLRRRVFSKSHCCGKNELLIYDVDFAPRGSRRGQRRRDFDLWLDSCVTPRRPDAPHWLALFVAAGLATAAILAVAGALAAPNGMAVAGKNDFQTTAPSAILIDAGSGTVLFEKNADIPMAPSSMAKLMTSEVVFNEIAHDRIKLERRIHRQ